MRRTGESWPAEVTHRLGAGARRTLWGTTVVAMVLTAAACSSSSKGSTGSASTSPGSGSSATGAPIKVGVICSCSGYSFAAGSAAVEDVYKAWVNTTNASGGINGHRIQLITEDDASNPGTSTTDAQTLISDHVDAIVDMSEVDTVWASAVQASKIPVVGWNVNNVPFYTNSDFFPEGETANSEVVAYVKTIKATGASDFGDLVCVESASCGQFEQGLKAVGQQLGVPLSFETDLSATSPNYTAQCLAAKQKNIRDLIVEDVTQIIARVATDCNQQGYDPTYVVGGGSYSPLMQTTPGLKKDTWDYFANLPSWDNVPEVQAMNKAVAKYYPGLEQKKNVWTESATQAWPAGILLEDAVKAGGLTASGTPSAAEITNGLYALKGDTLQGWSPPLTFTPGKPHPVNCWFTARVSNGVPSLLDNGHLTCSSGS